jgi:hypothetical protein
MNEDRVGLSAQQIAKRLSDALIEVQNKPEIKNDDIVALSEILRDYSTHPGSTEDGRANMLKRFQFVHQTFMNLDYCKDNA